ncbi:MAG TPA: DNA-binding protein [Desulfobacteraceae bacterium]|nr:DNA-binding protein [Desulfobacteraceae bacterium]
MTKDLTASTVDRQNVLNNPYALEEIESAIKLQTIDFEGKKVVLKEQIAQFFEIDLRTVERYQEAHRDELAKNGYETIKGKRLKELKLALSTLGAPDINVGSKVTQISIYDFRAFLNLAMLITESERAKLLRQTILDIVIDTINKRTGGGTKYINQRDEDFIISYFQEENYRKQFTDALKDCVDMGNFKYPMYTDKIYVSIFKENAQEYRKILRLHEKDKVRSTFYSEVLDVIASYECGFADVLQKECQKKSHKMNSFEADTLFKQFESQAHWKPLLEKARNKMASRDLAFRDALHLQLKDYITPLKADDFERFIGEKSKELSERLEDAKDVMKRLRERE